MRIVEHGAIEFLSRAIQLFKFACDHVGFVVAFTEQQTESQLRIRDAPRGVQPRRQDEAHASGSQRLPFKSGGANERAQTRMGGLCQQLETVAHHHPVLAAQGGNVGDCREGHQIQLPLRKRRGSTHRIA